MKLCAVDLPLDKPDHEYLVYPEERIFAVVFVNGDIGGNFSDGNLCLGKGSFADIFLRLDVKLCNFC